MRFGGDQATLLNNLGPPIGGIRGAIRLMRRIPEHSRLVFYAAPTGTDTTALSALPDIDNDSRNSFAVAGYICGNRNSFDSAWNATLSLPESFLDFREGEPARGFPRKPLTGNPVSENTILLGIPLNRRQNCSSLAVSITKP
jgi:hypothetical protein